MHAAKPPSPAPGVPKTRVSTPPGSLAASLARWHGGDAFREAIADAVGRIGDAAVELSQRVAGIPFEVGAAAGPRGLAVLAHGLVTAALRDGPVARFASEENEDVLVLREGAPLAVAVDPLDGASNVDTNVPVGTIFSILPMPAHAGADGTHDAPFMKPGRDQVAAGFVIYGPYTALVLTLGSGTTIFTLDPARRTFVRTRERVQIPRGTREYAINASTYRHWLEPIRAYIDDCIAGSDGPRGREFNMRWMASTVAEAFRILSRGGVFLYPRDARPGYHDGRIRLLFEANPLALLCEQADGAATDGERRILDIEPTRLHQRVPLVFGARDKVERIARYHRDPDPTGERSPLFTQRGLFWG